MTISPFSSKVLLRALMAVGFCSVVLQIVLAQKPISGAADKGPRAVGLIELSPNGKAHLVPVTVMVDGKFYDAAAYKASPVPMALETGTVYEGVLSGVSQGIFTVKSALNGVNSWRGQGTWQSAEEIKAAAAQKKAMQAAEKAQVAKAKADEDNARPILKRAGSKSSPAPGTGSSDGTKAASGKSPASSSSPTDSKKDSPMTATPPTIPVDDENDPQRPHLRRTNGMPNANDEKDEPPIAAPPVRAAGKAAPIPAHVPSSPEIQVIPAVSDAEGPEARPYTYDLKPAEEVNFRKKMLALATVEMRSYVKPSTITTATHVAHKRNVASATAFDDVQFRVFDLSNSNEPVLILMAKAQMPPTGDNSAATATPYLLTLIAREDIYGDLHKVVANITDSKHLDITPRLELIDAVDVDGDGRGELLFRKVSDAGSAYVVYRVIGNQLWPLFEGAIG